jgi:hypothetical protein
MRVVTEISFVESLDFPEVLVTAWADLLVEDYRARHVERSSDIPLPQAHEGSYDQLAVTQPTRCH